MSRLLLLLMLVCVVVLSGCSTAGQAKTDAPASKPTIVDNDIAYMARVERYATLRGIDLVWVHPPRAKQDKD